MWTQQSRLRSAVYAVIAAVWVLPLAGCTDAAEPLAPRTFDGRPRTSSLTGSLAVTSITGLEPILGATPPLDNANDINDAGYVVGRSIAADNTFHGAVWEPGSFFPIDLGELPGGGEGLANAIDAAGTIIVGAAEVPGGDRHAVRWVKVNGTWIIQDLGTLDPGGQLTAANAIADDGTIVGVDYADPGPENPRGVVWRNGVMMSLEPFGIVTANAVNNSGQVVGMNVDRHAVVWTLAGGVVDIGTLGGTFSVANDINASGEVVGESETSSGKRRAFLWTPKKGMIDLGPPNADVSAALGINADGDVVGNVQYAPLTATHAFLWSKGKTLDLGVLPGYELGDSFATAINKNGQVAGRSTVGPKERGTVWTLK